MNQPTGVDAERAKNAPKTIVVKPIKPSGGTENGGRNQHFEANLEGSPGARAEGASVMGAVGAIVCNFPDIFGISVPGFSVRLHGESQP